MLPLTEADQLSLLHVARQALANYVEVGKILEIPEPGEALRQPCGAFVTLRKGRSLRGCIGIVEAIKPLYLTVSECAVWAAVHDRRFAPVTKAEVPDLSLEISILSPLSDVTAESIEVGRHGLVISRGGSRGLLLPQVAVQWKWDRVRFLEETCRKAGLSSDAWRHGARIQAFTAQIIEERDPANSSHPAA